VNNSTEFTVAYIGTRAEALETLKSEFEVSSILCINGSWAHYLCEKRNWKATVINPEDREEAMIFLKSLTESILFSAGFPWIINKKVLDSSRAVKVNSHPSLLPLFPGKNAIKDALSQGATELGVTVHRMIPEVDRGPIIAQESILIKNMSPSEIYQTLFAILEPRVIQQAMNIIKSDLKSL
jgi:folate-dependent phosphoribosylglycinamide formyltransferase PurN